MNDVLNTASILLCMAAIVALQYRLFGSTVKTRTPNNVASFFFVQELLDRQQRTALALVSSVPLSFIFLVVAFNAGTFGKALIDAYLYAVGDLLPEGSLGGGQLVAHIPEPLYPVAILFVSFLFFGAQLKFLYLRIEKGVVFVAAVLSRTNRQLQEFSNILLTKHSYDDLLPALNRGRRTGVPLAEELEHSLPGVQLSFQLLHLAKFDVADSGVRHAVLRVIGEKLRRLLDREDQATLFGEDRLADDVPEPHLPDRATHWSYIAAGALVYVVVCGVYVGLIPMAYGLVSNRGITWPDPQYPGDMARSVIQASLATVAPILLGIIFYGERSMNVKETRIQRLFIVFALVFLFSLVVNIVFLSLPNIELFLGERKGSHAFGFPEFVYVLSHSLVPCLAVLVVTLVESRKILRLRNVFLAIVAAGLGHLVAYLAFENADDKDYPMGYYWHQALLGTVLTTAGVTLLAIFWKPRKNAARGVQVPDTPS